METKFDWCVRVLQISFKFIDRDIFEKTKRFSFGSMAFLMINLITLYGCCYTILYYDAETAFSAVVMLAGFTQVTIKYVLMDDLRSMIDVLRNIVEIHKKNAKQTARDHKLCGKYADLCKLFVIGIPIAYYTFALIFTLPAIFDCVTKGKIRPIYDIYLPGSNESDWIDMSVLTLINVMFVLYGGAMVFPSDIFLAINFASIPMFSTIIQRQINDFQDELKDKKKSDNSILIKKQLIDIIKMQLTYNEHIDRINNGFQRICFVQIATAFVFSIFSIFMITKFHKVVLMAAAILGVFQILAFCLMGTIVEISSTKLHDKVNAFEWYRLPHRHIKDYQIWLHQSQQPKILYIAKVKPLNMETSISILKSIYSYATILYSYV